MSKKRLNEYGLHQLYQHPERADKLLWGRRANPVTRRGFLKKSGLLAMSTALGASIPFAEYMPAGLIPAALADSPQPFRIPGKHPGLTVLNDRPVNIETPAHLLDDLITPADKLFVRNNGLPPTEIDANRWSLEIAGESVEKDIQLTLDQLKNEFTHYSYQLTVECGGNGRSEFYPPAKGNQWTVGAVGCPEWTGIRLKDVLQRAGLKDDAVYIGFYGADTNLQSEPDSVSISRGVPIAKALEDETLIAWAMNNQDIPLMHGYPLRLVCGGWPGSTSGKWLKKIVVRDKVHDGKKMTGFAYRIPCHPVAPGAQVSDDQMCIIESMPVKSLITYPKSGVLINQAQKLPIRGHAWAGDLRVTVMELSIDFGITWQRCRLMQPSNNLAWQHWHTNLSFPGPGYYEVWARATDSRGIAQPMLVPGWNPKGYLNNACHRIAVKVA